MNSYRKMLYLDEETKPKLVIKQDKNKQMERLQSLSLINKITQNSSESQNANVHQISPQLTKFKSFTNNVQNKSFQQISKDNQSQSCHGKSQQTIGRMKSYGAIPLSKRKLSKIQLKQATECKQPNINKKQDLVPSQTLDVFKAIVFYNEQLAKNSQNTNNSQKIKKTLKFKKKEEIGYMSSEISVNNNEISQQKKSHQFILSKSQKVIQITNDKLNAKPFDKNQFFSLFESFCPKNQQQAHYSSLGGEKMKKFALGIDMKLKNITEYSRDHQSDTKLNKSSYQNCPQCGGIKQSIDRQKVVKFCEEMQKIHVSLRDMNIKLLIEFKKFRKQCELKIMKMLEKMPDFYEDQINMYQTEPVKKIERQELQSSLIQNALSQISQPMFAKTKSEVEFQMANEKIIQNNKIISDKNLNKKQIQVTQQTNKNKPIEAKKQEINKQGLEKLKTTQFEQSKYEDNQNPSPQSNRSNTPCQTFRSQQFSRLTGRIVKNIIHQKQQTYQKRRPFNRMNIPKIDLPLRNQILSGLDFDDPIFSQQNNKFNGQMVSSKNPRSPPTRQIVINTERIGRIFKNLPLNKKPQKFPSSQQPFITHRGTRSLHESVVSSGSREDYKSCYANIKQALSRLKQIF